MVMIDKKDKYDTLCAQIKSLSEGENNVIGVLSNVSAAMHETFPESYFWVGFYLVNGDELLLGPFQGSVACYRIKKGRGVCGKAWAENSTIIVDDVDAFPGHIACSSLSRSEVVVPIHSSNGDVYGVIDIDSKELATFDATDGLYIEKIANILSKQLQF
ncbi:MAG: GAF domain-containing protein [Prevotella sp.]|jgi:GAF domain-containing protein|nr:GAF domain-containing protein [Prevotella sp.]MBP6528009.1 GAF domain-containing protein [Prevotella sp.]MBP8687186.1 GAF domain-containing protein [Prevotella sp.]MBP8935692.1 GAF domain-containing protein [Prevotella sp.]MBP9982400.1 GAF domain-containing protein [Prevotella sp.]